MMISETDATEQNSKSSLRQSRMAKSHIGTRSESVSSKIKNKATSKQVELLIELVDRIPFSFHVDEHE
jgi:hypothetical protein